MGSNEPAAAAAREPQPEYPAAMPAYPAPQIGYPAAAAYPQPMGYAPAYPGYAPTAYPQSPPGAYMWMPPQPIPGLTIKPSKVPPSAGMVVTSYQVEEPQGGCCECGTLNESGMIAFVVLLLFFWPLAWLPCVMRECHQKYQYPVYGYAPPAYGPPQGAQPPPGMPQHA